MKIEKITGTIATNNQFFNNTEISEIGFEELLKNIFSNTLVNTETNIAMKDKEVVKEDSANTAANILINRLNKEENKQGMILANLANIEELEREMKLNQEIGEIGEVDIGVLRYGLGRVARKEEGMFFKEVESKQVEEVKGEGINNIKVSRDERKVITEEDKEIFREEERNIEIKMLKDRGSKEEVGKEIDVKDEAKKMASIKQELNQEIGEIGEVDIGVLRYGLGKTITNKQKNMNFEELIGREVEEGILNLDILDENLIKYIVKEKEPYMLFNEYVKVDVDKEIEKKEVKNETNNKIETNQELDLKDIFKQLNFNNIFQFNFKDINQDVEVVNDNVVNKIETKNYKKDHVDFNYSNVKLNYDLEIQDTMQNKGETKFNNMSNINYDFSKKSRVIENLSTHNEEINLGNTKDTNNFISLDTVKNKIVNLVKQLENDNSGAKNDENKNGIELMPRFSHQNVELKTSKYMDTSEIEENLKYITKNQDISKDIADNLEVLDKHVLGDNDIYQRKFIKHDFDVSGMKQEEHNVSKLSDIINIVASKFKNLKNENISELKVTLKPKELGEIIIKVIYNEGNIEGTITASNKEVANALQNNINNLKEQIKQNDIQFKEININVKTDDNSKEKNNQENRRQQRKQNKEIFKLDEDKLDGITL